MHMVPQTANLGATVIAVADTAVARSVLLIDGYMKHTGWVVDRSCGRRRRRTREDRYAKVYVEVLCVDIL